MDLISAADVREARKNYHAQIVDELGRAICAGTPAVGELLPPEQILAAQLGVSRPVLREAIRSLMGKGMLEARSRVGTRVRPRSSWNLLDSQVLAWSAAAREGSVAAEQRFVTELLELRRIIEPQAVRFAADRARLEDLQAIRAAYGQMAAASAQGGLNRDAAFEAADVAFHRAILEAAHNDFIWQLHAPLTSLLRASLHMSFRLSVNRGYTLPQHKALLQGIECRNAGAAVHAVEQLIDRAESDLQASIDADAYVQLDASS